MADQTAEQKKAATTDDEPEPTPYEAGEWVEAATDRPPGQVLVFYSVPGQDPDVRLGSCDGESYNDELTGRSTPIADVGGFKSVMSEAPKDPGMKSKNQAAEKDAKDTKDAPKAEAKK